MHSVCFRQKIVVNIPQFQSQSCQRAGLYLDVEAPSWSRSPSLDFEAPSQNDPPSAWTSAPPPEGTQTNRRRNCVAEQTPQTGCKPAIPTHVTYLASKSFHSLVNTTKRALSHQLQNVIQIHVDGKQQEANGNLSTDRKWTFVRTHAFFLCVHTEYAYTCLQNLKLNNPKVFARCYCLFSERYSLALCATTFWIR